MLSMITLEDYIENRPIALLLDIYMVLLRENKNSKLYYVNRNAENNALLHFVVVGLLIGFPKAN